jgi:cell division septation protein DedD
MSANNFSLKSNSRSVWIKRAIAIFVLLGFTWLIITAVSSTSSEENLNPDLVKAPTMIKQRPDAPGGMKIDHQDKKLFDLLESENSSNSVSDSVIEKAAATAHKDVALVKQAVDKKTQEVKQAAEVVETKVEDAKEKVTQKVVEIVDTKPVEVKAEVEKQTVTSGWAVQLGSFRKTEDAQRAVGLYTDKVGNTLAGLTSYIKRVDLGDKGIVYRVYFTGIKDGESAKQICSQLKVQKQACLRAKI